jgi:YgiT-type zinc finger domain-containing protein
MQSGEQGEYPMKPQGVVELEIETEERSLPLCTNCGSQSIHTARIRSAFWHDDRLVVVEDIPAVVCDDCHEQFFDDGAIIVLDLLRGDGFPAEKARSELRVPVFSFNDRLGAEEKS